MVSGDPDTVHAAGVSVRGRTVSEAGMELEDYEDHLAEWPGIDPGNGDRRAMLRNKKKVLDSVTVDE